MLTPSELAKLFLNYKWCCENYIAPASYSKATSTLRIAIYDESIKKKVDAIIRRNLKADIKNVEYEVRTKEYIRAMLRLEKEECKDNKSPLRSRNRKESPDKVSLETQKNRRKLRKKGIVAASIMAAVGIWMTSTIAGSGSRGYRSGINSFGEYFIVSAEIECRETNNPPECLKSKLEKRKSDNSWKASMEYLRYFLSGILATAAGSGITYVAFVNQDRIKAHLKKLKHNYLAWLNE